MDMALRTLGSRVEWVLAWSSRVSVAVSRDLVLKRPSANGLAQFSALVWLESRLSTQFEPLMNGAD